MNARNMLLAAAAMIAGCSQPAENQAGNATANAAKPAVKHPTYCFFKDAETKGWAAKRGKDGNVAVTGKAHVKDSAYKADFNPVEVSGTGATAWLTLGPNTGQFGAPDNWWDVDSTIPNSAGVNQVTLMCGKKIVAELSVKG